MMQKTTTDRPFAPASIPEDELYSQDRTSVPGGFDILSREEFYQCRWWVMQNCPPLPRIGGTVFSRPKFDGVLTLEGCESWLTAEYKEKTQGGNFPLGPELAENLLELPDSLCVIENGEEMIFHNPLVFARSLFGEMLTKPRYGYLECERILLVMLALDFMRTALCNFAWVFVNVRINGRLFPFVWFL